MTWTSPRTWVTSEVLTAALLNTHLRDNLLELNSTASAWTAYTPTLTNWAPGIDIARYKQIGKTVHVEWVFGCTGASSGTMVVSLPVTAHGSTATFNGSVGHGFASDASTGATDVTSVYLASSTTVNFNSNAGVYGASIPWVWVASDRLRAHLTYEAA
jgi:hypothetical protein